MTKKIDKTVAYYMSKRQAILDAVNNSTNLTADQIISYGEEMSILEYKLTALEIARDN